MGRAAALLGALLGWLGCSAAPGASVDGGAEHEQAPDGAREARTTTIAPDDVPPEDWVLFQCPSCSGTPAGLRAARCDGSAEILLGRPDGTAEITGARLAQAMLAITVRDGDGWAMWTRRAGVWEAIDLGETGAGVAKHMGGPHLESYFSGSAASPTRLVYARTFDT